jgi:EF-P beta-lysylation protein EpmB
VSWTQILRQNIRSSLELSKLLGIEIFDSPFPLNLPRRLAEKIEPGNRDDPILRQFVPLPEENIQTPGFTSDPVGEGAARQQPRLLQKYPGRALLVTTSACAMHCRYCFRRHFDYALGAPSYDAELEQIANDPTLLEVILSGGDPLSLPNRPLLELIGRLEMIPHLQILRFHSRFPIGIPERVDDELLQGLASSRLQIYFVLHTNHPRELDADVIAAIRRLQGIGIPVLNQAVLTRGVNDDLETLTELCRELIAIGVMPYYLHALDPVEGAAHFDVPEEKGLELVEALRQRLPGYAVPQFVREIAGEASKTPLHSFDSGDAKQLQALF